MASKSLEDYFHEAQQQAERQQRSRTAASFDSFRQLSDNTVDHEPDSAGPGLGEIDLDLIRNVMANLLQIQPEEIPDTRRIDVLALPIYTYAPLPRDNCIRLLHFESAEYESSNARSQKVCSLNTFSIDEAPMYMALSYTWGCPLNDPTYFDIFSQDQTWILDDTDNAKRIRVGFNLYKGLQRISRLNGNIKYIWIDALCINQADLVERGKQVSLMGEIYSKAEQVVVWLGDCHPEEARQIWEVHYELAPAIRELIVEEGFAAMSTGDWDEDYMVEKFSLDNIFDSSWWIIYQNFFRRMRWFSRAWCFQEFVLARRVAFMLADRQIAWEDLLVVAQFLFFSGLSGVVFEPEEQDAPHARPGALLIQLADFGQWVKWCKSGDPHGLEIMQQALGFQGQEKLAWKLFEEALLTIRLMQSTDARDRVYAALGILQLEPSNKNIIVPDYSLDIRVVFQHATEALLVHLPGLEALALCQNTNRATIENLPSWVPDFNVTSAPLIHCSKFNASGNGDVIPKLEFSGVELHLRGRIVDTILAVYDSRAEYHDLDADDEEDMAYLLLSTVSIWLRAAEHFLRLSKTDRDAMEVLWNTLVVEQRNIPLRSKVDASHFEALWTYAIVMSRRPNLKSRCEQLMVEEQLDTFVTCRSRPSARSLGMYTAIEKGKQGQLKSSERETTLWEELRLNAKAFSEGADLYGRERQLLVTSQGRLGLGPTTAKVGDKIALLDGGAMLYILRSADTDHNFVGEAYVHDCMDGQLASEVSDHKQIILI